MTKPGRMVGVIRFLASFLWYRVARVTPPQMVGGWPADIAACVRTGAAPAPAVMWWSNRGWMGAGSIGSVIFL